MLDTIKYFGDKRADALVGKNEVVVSPLYKHQQQTVKFASTIKRYADLSDMGTGKTRTQLQYISDYHASYHDLKVLIIAPKSIILSSWIGDIEKFYPELSAVAVIGSKMEKLELLRKDATIYITNYETMNQGIDFTVSGIDYLVCDEAIKLKNPRAKWTKAITELSRFVPSVALLSGLITPNNLLEVFGPFNIVAPGVLGKNFWQFREHYFTPDPYSFENRSWLPKKHTEDRITDLLSPYIIRHTKAKCLDLPDKIHTKRSVEMTAKQRVNYNQMKKEAVLQLKDSSISAVNKATVIQKLAQISSGFIYDHEKKIHTFESAKVRELEDIINGELANDQVLIFTNFKAETKLFREKYPEESFIYGGQSSNEQIEDIEKFQNGDNRLMFASVAAAKYGLTFTNCHYVIYFSMNYSLDDFAQSQDRIHRIGQQHNAQYIYLLSSKSIDEVIYKALQTKKKLNDLIVELIESK